MTNKAKPSFFRLFLGGFAFGAVALAAVQVTQTNDAAMIPAAYAATR